MTESDLFELSSRDRPLLGTSSFGNMDRQVAQTVLDQTIQEVQTGALEGPFSLESIPTHFPLSKLFGVQQGEKVRNVDDFSLSGVNACAQTGESPKPHTLDVVASLCSALMSSNAGTSSNRWKCRSFDLKGAYRQCAVHPESEPFSHIVASNPDANSLAAFRMNALPFGSVRSVHSFLRVAHSLWFLDILWCNYFDDFVTFGLEEECGSITSAVHSSLVRSYGLALCEVRGQGVPLR